MPSDQHGSRVGLKLTVITDYQKRSKQIELLHYELSHPARVSENEIIGALALAHGDGEKGHPGGHASDKTLYIALNYQARANHVNSDTAEEVGLQEASPFFDSLIIPQSKWTLQVPCGGQFADNTRKFIGHLQDIFYLQFPL